MDDLEKKALKLLDEMVNVEDYSEDEILLENFLGSLVNKVKDVSTFIGTVADNGSDGTTRSKINKGLDAVKDRRGTVAVQKIKKAAIKLIEGLSNIDKSFVSELTQNKILSDQFSQGLINLILSVKVSPEGAFLKTINRAVGQKLEQKGIKFN
jgi:hypothetical protein